MMVGSIEEPELRQEQPSPPLDVMLRGSLPCVNCRYELQGLSIRGKCPECGLAIRATILHRVDPQAEALQPLPTRRLTAWCVAGWPTAGLIAVGFAWLARLFDAYTSWTGRPAPNLAWEDWGAIVALAASALCTVGLIRPTRQTSARWVIVGAVGALAYLPLVWSWSRIAWGLDPYGPPPYFQAGPNPARLALRLCVGASALVILLALRHNARQLVARSLVLRTGRVGRQTIYATASAVGVAMLGDTVRLASSFLSQVNRPLIEGAGAILVLIGSLLVTLALIGASIDGWRIARAILTPSPSLGEIIQIPPTAASEDRFAQ